MNLQEIAQIMTGNGKGILAADESNGTCGKRFDGVGIEKTEENRRLYRQMLLTTPELESSIGGVILYDETFRQKADNGQTFPELLFAKGIMPGIKVDMGLKDLVNFPREKHTSGLDGLRERLAEYAKLGAKFAKWRAAITITDTLPSDCAVWTSAKELAHYAALCQEAGIVPIVEPEVLIDGNHTIERSKEVMINVLSIVFKELKNFKVDLTGTVLKPSMVIAGSDCDDQASVAEVADMTVAVLKKCVPANVAGIAFLSGGQTEIQATENLNAMNQNHELPWNLTFSYGRALQQSALNTFATGDTTGAQALLGHRAKMNSKASKGEYTSSNEA